jgi:hypothetical protein
MTPTLPPAPPSSPVRPSPAGRFLVSLCWCIVWYAGSRWLLGWLADHALPRSDFFAFRRFALVQILGVAAWEAAAFRRKDAAWLPALWLPRLLAVVGLGALTVTAMFAQGETEREPGLSLGIYAAVIAGSWYWHRRKRRDLFMLNLGLFSVTGFLLALIFISSLGSGGMVLGVLFITAALCAGAWEPVQRRLWGRDAEAGPEAGPETGPKPAQEPAGG